MDINRTFLSRNLHILRPFNHSSPPSHQCWAHNMSSFRTYSNSKLSLRRDGIFEDEISSHGPPEDPHESESTPLLAGPSCKPSYRTQVPASACNDNTLTVEESLSKPNSLDFPPTSERVSRRRSSSLGSSYDIQRGSRSTSTTAHGASETCSEPCQPLPTSPHIRSPLFSLPQGISLRLENSGSVARDHLASERTFLAYMRTSLAIASSGVGEPLLVSPTNFYQTFVLP